MKRNQWNQNGEGSTWQRSGTVVHDLRFTFWYVNSIIEPLPKRNELTPGGRRSRLPELTARWPSKIASFQADCRMAVEDRDRQMSDPHWCQHRPVRGSDTKWDRTMALLDVALEPSPLTGVTLVHTWWHHGGTNLQSHGSTWWTGGCPAWVLPGRLAQGPSRQRGRRLGEAHLGLPASF